MDPLIKSVMITGGCGFIGSGFTNYIVNKYKDTQFVVVDILDYCATLNNLHVRNNKNFHFYHVNILNHEQILKILKLHNIDTIIHFAAQTHVDNSFQNSIKFTENNILGTHHLLEASRVYGGIKRFIHMSTDEVYGEIIEGKFDTQAYLNPTNPYAATKAAAEHIINAYNISYKMPTLIIRMNNVYGPRQYPEKVIPKFLKCLLNDEKCPVHGDGLTRRNFIYIDDVVTALEAIMIKGQIGQVYNIGTDCEYSVMDILKMLVKIVKGSDDITPWVDYVSDRNYNDKRYAITNDKISSLGWVKKYDFEEGLKQTADWYSKLYQSNQMSTHWIGGALP